MPESFTVWSNIFTFPYGNGFKLVDNSSNKNNEIICFCFDYSRQDIIDDALKNGRSFILERIIAEKKSGGCSCAKKNPKGR